MQYDLERVKKFNEPHYDYKYTFTIRSGVCRDFSNLFYEICLSLEIPCYRVVGKTPMTIKKWLKRTILLKDKSTNHQWNLVKYDGEWHLMDPTWTDQKFKHVYTSYDHKGNEMKDGVTGIANRDYFNTDPEIFRRTHTAIVPAMNLLSTLPKFRTARGKGFKILVFDYEFNEKLNSAFNNSRLGGVSENLSQDSIKYYKNDDRYQHFVLDYYTHFLTEKRVLEERASNEYALKRINQLKQLNIEFEELTGYTSHSLQKEIEGIEKLIALKQKRDLMLTITEMGLSENEESFNYK